MWQAVLRGQEPYSGSVKEQENQSQDVKQECRKSCREKAKSSDAWLWGGWSRSSETTRESSDENRDKRRASQNQLDRDLDFEEPYESRGSRTVPRLPDGQVWEV